MARIRVSVLGPVRLEINGAPVHLTPLTQRLLVRLVAAEGEAVPVRLLRREVWGLTAELPGQAERDRNEVQKRVLELRRALDARDLGNEGFQTALRLGGGTAIEVKRILFRPPPREDS